MSKNKRYSICLVSKQSGHLNVGIFRNHWFCCQQNVFYIWILKVRTLKYIHTRNARNAANALFEAMTNVNWVLRQKILKIFVPDGAVS